MRICLTGEISVVVSSIGISGEFFQPLIDSESPISNLLNFTN